MTKFVKFMTCIIIIGTIAVAAILALPYIKKALYPMEYEEYIEKYANEYNLPQELVCAVIYTESHFDKDAVSDVGAKGLMQIMPDTFEWLCKREGENHNIEELTTPEINIKYGILYLSYLYDRFGDWETVAAAYNAGPNKVASWLKNEDYSDDGVRLKHIPISETENYVNRVFSAEKQYKEIYFNKED